MDGKIDTHHEFHIILHDKVIITCVNIIFTIITITNQIPDPGFTDPATSFRPLMVDYAGEVWNLSLACFNSCGSKMDSVLRMILELSPKVLLIFFIFFDKIGSFLIIFRFNF